MTHPTPSAQPTEHVGEEPVEAGAPRPAPRRRVLRGRPAGLRLPGWDSPWVAALVLALLVLGYLYKPILTGGYYFPSGNGAGWTFTRLAGQTYPPFNLRQIDMYLDTGPWLRYDIAAVHAGHLPLWNSYNGAGVPHLGNLQSAVFSPWNLPFYVLPFRIALIVSAFLKLWALGFATWLFLRAMRLSWIAALIGAMGYMFGGMHMLWLNWEMPSSVFMLPFGCWCLVVAARTESRRRRRWAFVGLALSTAASLLAGQIEIFAWGAILVAAFAVLAAIRFRHGLRARLGFLLSSAGVMVLALALTAVQAVPFLEYMVHSLVFHSRSEESFLGTFPHQAFGMTLFPNLAGPIGHAYGQSRLQAHFALQPTTSFLGLAILVLALIGIARCRQQTWRGPVLFFLIVGVVTLVLESSMTVAAWWHAVPALGTDLPLRSSDLVLFPAAFLAACGVDVLRSPLSRRARLTAAAVVPVALAAAGVLAIYTWHWLGLLYGVSTRVPAHKLYVIQQTALLLGIAGVGLIVFAVLVSRRRPWLRAVASVVLVATVWAVTAGPWLSYNPTSPGHLLYPTTTSMRQLQDRVGDDRVFSPGNILPAADANMDFGIATGTNYDSIDVDDYARVYLGATNKPVVSTPDADSSTICVARLRTLGMRWVLGGTGTAAGQSLPLVTRIGPTRTPLYQVPDAQTFELARQVTAVSNDDAALTQVLRCNREPGTAVLDGTAGDLPSGAGSGSTGSVRVLHRDQEHIALATTAPTGRWLIARQTYYPGWQASIDGRRTALRRADVAFQAVYVPAGTHRVTLDYRPASVRIGAVISLVALLPLIALVLPYRRRRRRRVAPSSNDEVTAG